MVYKLYDLTYDEVLSIDKEFNLTERQYNYYQLLKGEIMKNEMNTNQKDSRFNDIRACNYYKELKSENLTFADIAWLAKNTYGWKCEDIISMEDKIYTDGSEIAGIDNYYKSQLKGYYQIALSSSGVKVRVYPRKDTYPIITNENGGWD